jgi:hypothetical protein
MSSAADALVFGGAMTAFFNFRSVASLRELLSFLGLSSIVRRFAV